MAYFWNIRTVLDLTEEVNLCSNFLAVPVRRIIHRDILTETLSLGATLVLVGDRAPSHCLQ